jgi:xylan 1,4-beta-xylosidase
VESSTAVALRFFTIFIRSIGGASQSGASQGSRANTAIQQAADTRGPGKPLVHFWSRVVGAGRASEGLRATWQEELATAAKYDGFQYVRFLAIFQGNMFIYREDAQGNPIYNFQYVDDLYDRMLAARVRPFVELSFSPGPLAPVRNTTFEKVREGNQDGD